MTVYDSSFQDADYGCGSPSQISGQFTINPTGFSRSDDDPSIGLVNFSYINQLTLANVQYSTTTNQDVSAWLVYTTNAEPLGSIDKTFVPRQNCTTTTNSLTGTVLVPVDSTDTFVKFGARWSGFNDNPDGLPMDSLEWFNFDLADNYKITPPQNLQVTFPSTPDGEINATIASWSLNPNIDGTVQADGYSWNWKVELLSASGDVLTVKEFNNTSLTPTLIADTSKVKPNTSYSLKVTVSNAFQATTSIESPTIKSLPPAPIIRRVTFTEAANDTYTAHIDWAKPQSGAEFNEWVTLNVPGYITNQQIAAVTDGVSQIDTVDVSGLPAATAITITLANTSSAGQQETTQTVYTPSEVPTIAASWDSVRRCVTITPTASNITTFDMTLGYNYGDDSLGRGSGESLQSCDLNHGDGQILYASATPKLDTHIYIEAKGFTTIPILNPILGIAKNCNDTLNIVDIVEKKNNETTQQWQTGDRVVVKEPCPKDPIGEGLGFYNITVECNRTFGLGYYVGVYTFRGRLTPNTQIEDVRLEYEGEVNYGVKYSLQLIGREFELVCDTTNSTSPYPYSFHGSVMYGPNSQDGCTFSLPNSNGVFAGSTSGSYPAGADHLYDVEDGVLKAWTQRRYFPPSRFPQGQITLLNYSTDSPSGY